MVVIVTIPAGFSETTERITVKDARNARHAITEAKKQFPREKRDWIKAEVEE